LAESEDVYFVDRELIPAGKFIPQELSAANPIYAALRSAAADPGRRQQIEQDLDQLALIAPAPRFVLVDIATARLWMIEGGRIASSMKVVTGKPGMATPKMAALIRFAVLDPYWHLPPDLVRERVTQNVLMDGPGWLRTAGLEPVTSYGPGGERLEPATVDWIAVATGEQSVGLRQKPGRFNTMGAVKFMFPNRLGIYLHDTPETRLFRAADRQFSSGCVRLEKAGELYRWLMGDTLPVRDPGRPERRVDLPAPVPVYILDLPSLKQVALPPAAGRTVA
jgi:murein L,D-transpeptidase YcbB/YkuD